MRSRPPAPPASRPHSEAWASGTSVTRSLMAAQPPTARAKRAAQAEPRCAAYGGGMGSRAAAGEKRASWVTAAVAAAVAAQAAAISGGGGGGSAGSCKASACLQPEQRRGSGASGHSQLPVGSDQGRQRAAGRNCVHARCWRRLVQGRCGQGRRAGRWRGRSLLLLLLGAAWAGHLQEAPERSCACGRQALQARPNLPNRDVATIVSISPPGAHAAVEVKR